MKKPKSKSECRRLIIQSLPKGKHLSGYTRKEVEKILLKWDIPFTRFWAKFGINTASSDRLTGETIYYVTDIERTLRACINETWIDIEEWD